MKVIAELPVELPILIQHVQQQSQLPQAPNKSTTLHQPS